MDSGERRALTAVSVVVVRTRRHEVFVTGSTLYAREVNPPPPQTTPLVIAPFSAAAGIFVENGH